jgi:gliding motility-associated-like protein
MNTRLLFKYFWVFSILFSIHLDLSAAHLTGGDMTYRCVGNASNGNPIFQFSLNIYRDNLSQGADFDNPAFITIFNLDNNTRTDISATLLPSNRSDVPLNDLGPCARNVPNVSISKALYTFERELAPNQNGYLVVHQRCCRPNNITNLFNPGTQGSTYFVRVTPEALAFCNDSPIFVEDPPILICANSTFTYRFTGFESNGDSLVYRLCQPLLGGTQQQPRPQTMTAPPYSTVNYNAGFSPTNPLGANVPVILDPRTGILTMRPDRVGIFTVAICIDEYRSGRLIGTISRDIQFNVADCIVPEASATIPAAEPLPGIFATCTGQTVQFRNNSVDAQTNFWDFGVPGTLADTSRQREPIFTYPDSGTYNVTLIINRGQACADTARLTIRIFPTLDADFSEDAVCPGTPVNFRDLSISTASPIIKWSWNFGNGDTSEEQSPTYLFNGSGTFQVKLKVETEIGCVDSITKTIVLPVAPESIFTIQANRVNNSDTFALCTDTRAISFTNQSAAGVRSFWMFGVPGATSTERDPTFIYPDTGTYRVMLITEPGTTCADTSVKYIRVVPALVSSFIFTTECVKAPVFFTTTTNPPWDPVTTTNWVFGDGTTSAERNPEKTYANAGTYNVRLTVRTGLGCQAQVTRPVQVAPAPVADFLPQGLALPNGNFIRCENNLSILFQNQSTGNNVNTWQLGVVGATSTQVSPSYTFPQTGNFDIKLVINPGRICSDSITKTIRLVNGIGAPNFDVEDACVSTSVRFTNRTSAPLNDITVYRWEFGDGTTANIRNPQKTYTQPGTYNVKMYAETAQGCRDSITKQVTIWPAPRPLFDVEKACKNVPVTISNNSSITDGSIVSYNWNFGNGATSALESPTTTYNTAGNYNVVLSATSDRGCVASYTDVINIRTSALPDFSFVNQCVKAPAVFTDLTTTPYNNTVGWQWTFEPGQTSTLQNPSYTFSDAGAFEVELLVISDEGCRDSVKKTIVIAPAPIADFTIDGISGGPGIFIKCDDNFRVNFLNLSSGNDTDFWTFGVPGASSSLENPNYIYPDTGFYAVTLVINQGTLCVDDVTYTIRTLPALTIGFEVADTCVINDILFTNTSTTALNDINFISWDFGDGNTATSFNAVNKYNTHGTYPVALIVGTEKGCLDTLVKNAVAFPMPIADISAPEACPRQRVTVRSASSSVPGSSISNYEWSLGNGATSTSRNPNVTYDAPGLYNLQLIVTTNLGCKDTAEDLILVRDFIVPIITQGAMTFCEDKPVFFGSENSTGIFQQVLWNFDNGVTSALASDSAIFSNAGKYTVRLTLTDSLCGSTFVTSDIDIIREPVINLGPDFALCPSLSAPLNIGTVVYDTVRWSTGQRDVNRITIDGSVGTVKVEVFEKGCYVLDSVVVTPSCDVIAPSAFTPNGDGVNDIFNLLPGNVESFTLFVYNRWGQLVFSTDRLTRGWDGTWENESQPMDNYLWYAEGIKTDGRPFSIKGAVMLIR